MDNTIILDDTILCLTFELCIATLVIVLIWINNFFCLIKFPDTYKIIRIDKQENRPKFLNNFMYNADLNFLSIDYTFVIVKYDKNIIISKTFYNLFGDSLTVKEDGEENPEIISQSTYAYYFLVIIPLFIGIFLRLFKRFIYFNNQNFISYNDVFFTIIFWLLIGFFFPTLLKSFISELKNEWQKVKKEQQEEKK